MSMQTLPLRLTLNLDLLAQMQHVCNIRYVIMVLQGLKGRPGAYGASGESGLKGNRGTGSHL